MDTSTLNKLIEEFQDLSLEDKEYINKIFEKQIIESKRNLLEKRVKEAMSNFESGNIKSGNIQDLYKDLEID